MAVSMSSRSWEGGLDFLAGGSDVSVGVDGAGIGIDIGASGAGLNNGRSRFEADDRIISITGLIVIEPRLLKLVSVSLYERPGVVVSIPRLTGSENLLWIELDDFSINDDCEEPPNKCTAEPLEPLS